MSTCGLADQRLQAHRFSPFDQDWSASSPALWPERNQIRKIVADKYCLDEAELGLDTRAKCRMRCPGYSREGSLRRDGMSIGVWEGRKGSWDPGRRLRDPGEAVWYGLGPGPKDYEERQK